MTAAAIQPPLISTKHQKSATVIFLHSKRMRSIQYIIITICAIILFGTVLYFGIRDYKHEEEKKIKEEIQIFPVSKEPLSGEIETINIDELKPKIEYPHQEMVEKGSSKQEIKTENLETIKFVLEEGAITESAGSLFLKSALKNMACSTSEELPISISCCGQLLFSEDGSDKSHGCLIMDTYSIGEGEDEQQRYRLRFIMEHDLVIYEDVKGFPKPDSKCYPIENKSGKQICASINFVALEDKFSDKIGYNSCTFMHFGYGPKVSENKNSEDQLLGYAENIKCDIDRETIINKGLKTPYSVVLKLKLEPKTSETLKTDGKENSTVSTINETEIEDGNKQPQKNQEIEKTDLEVVPEDNNQNKNGDQSENTNKQDSETNLAIVPLSYFSGPSLSSESTDDITSDEFNETFQPDSSDFLPVSTVPDSNNSFTSFFNTILDFIKNHILSVFYSRS